MTPPTCQDSRIAVIIPARGGSKTIPRKNLRMLCGKPLIAWTIESALRSGVAEKVYVSTDSPEIAEIAVRFGAVSIDRDGALAGDDVPLDPVIADAVRQIEGSGEPIDLVVTIQATCPLITPETIRTVIEKCRDEALDTVLTAVEDKALRWGVRDGAYVPLYEKRLNRQQMDPVYRETGGVVACRRSLIEGGTRFGTKVGLVVVDHREAVDIDEYHDWTMAENHLTRKRILFHVIGYPEVGLGHVYRALTLAEHLGRHDVSFIVSSPSALAASLIRSRHYPVESVPIEILEERIEALRPDVLINDILDTEASYVRRIRAAGIRCINFEDLGPGADAADRVINAMYEPEQDHLDHILSGSSYVCLRSEFYSVEPRPVRAEVEEVLVLFGGTDPSHLTVQTLEWLNEEPGRLSVQVVLGMGFSGDRAEVDRLAAASPHCVRIDQDVPVISSIMNRADLAITSAGRTVFELASLGIPMIVLAQNDREMTHVFARTNPGIGFLGRGNSVDRDRFSRMFQKIRNSAAERRNMQHRLLAMNVRRGIDQVIDVIHQTAVSAGDTTS